MQKTKGFTLVEVALFIAISGLILIGIIISTKNSIDQQRYNDSVQNFLNFLSGVYSEASDPKSASDGRSEKAIYGKLVTFGEDGSEGKIYSYDIIGDANGNIGGSDVLSALKSLSATPIVVTESATNQYLAAGAGFVESYTANWGAKISIVNSSNFTSTDKGALLVVRSPMSGILYTFVVTDKTVEVQKAVAESNASPNSPNYTNPLTSFLDQKLFTINDMDFCLSNDGVRLFGDIYRDIRIYKNAHNASVSSR